MAGNWKMNKKLQEGIELANEINRLIDRNINVCIIIAPPFIHLPEINKIITPDFISLAAQNCAAEPKGAFTGEVSAEMIQSTGAKYVIIGHSERRTYYEENDQILRKKVELALENKLIPIFCCGEHLNEREDRKHFSVVKQQIEKALFSLSKKDFIKIIIAYEPVWAIGTGKTATSEQAQEMHNFIRNTIRDKYSKEVADEIPVLYGGSCNPSNTKELFANPDVDGGLIGGASLKSKDFFDIINSF